MRTSAIVFLLSLLSFQYCKCETYTTSKNNGAKVWNLKFYKSRSVEWRGEQDDAGYATGRGVVLFFDNQHLSSAYLGDMHEGHMDGQAIAIYVKTGMCYVGQIKDWSENGYGMMRFADGGRYEGFWLNGDRSGVGIQWDHTGDVKYKGDFLNDVPLRGAVQFPRPDIRQDHGALVQKKFASTKIEWFGAKNKSGDAIGIGVAVSHGEDGISGIYHGLASNGRLDTNVVAIYANPRWAYVGDIRDWDENGYGQMYFSDRTIFLGRWENAKRQGVGICMHDNGEKERVEYIDDVIVKKAIAFNGPHNVVLQDGPTNEYHYEEYRQEERQGSLDEEKKQALINILGVIAGQKLLEKAVDDEHTWSGAFVSVASKYFIRSPIIDQNLHVLLPDAPPPGIRFCRNVICSLCDGTMSLNDLAKREAKSEIISAARSEGTDAGNAVLIFNLLNDIRIKIQNQEE